MDEGADRLQNLEAIEAIRRLLTNMFMGMDRFDEALVDSCFAPEGRVYIGGLQYRGPGALSPEEWKWRDDISPADVKARTHVMGQCDIQLDGDRARTETYVVAYLVCGGNPSDQLVMRGLRYHDQLVRRDGRWLIDERRHNCDWMFSVEPTMALAHHERIQLSS